LVSGLIIYSKY